MRKKRLPPNPLTAKKTVAKEQKEKKKLSFNEKREFEKIEAKIPKLEEEKAGLIEQLNNSQGDHEELMELSAKIEKLTAELDDMEMRWLELSEYL